MNKIKAIVALIFYRLYDIPALIVGYFALTRLWSKGYTVTKHIVQEKSQSLELKQENPVDVNELMIDPNVVTTLKRDTWREDGILGKFALSHAQSDSIAFRLDTLEHAFNVSPKGEGFGIWKPALPPGKYLCVRGKHRLKHMTEDFETFEITNVPGHTKILFHWGNWNKDSEGCVLLGLNRIQTATKPEEVINSIPAFDKFMLTLTGVHAFWLTVS